MPNLLTWSHSTHIPNESNSEKIYLLATTGKLVCSHAANTYSPDVVNF